jgi:hypothetical protein
LLKNTRSARFVSATGAVQRSACRPLDLMKDNAEQLR